MWQYRYPDELYHYGVKGMKWGVRKDVYKKMSISERRNQKKKYLSSADGQKYLKTQNDNFNDAQRTAINQTILGVGMYGAGMALKSGAGYETVASRLLKQIGGTAAVTGLAGTVITQVGKNYCEDRIYGHSNGRNTTKRYGTNKNTVKDLEKRYGELEDKMTYGKNADAKTNARLEKQMNDIEDQIKKFRKKR